MSLFKYPIIISSFKMYEYCKNKYTQREVHSDRYVGNEEFYYWSRTGRQRMVRNKKEIWVLGNEWPEMVRVR